MGDNTVNICPCCGQKIVTYKHKLNKVLVSGLNKLSKHGGYSKLRDLDLTISEFNNFQKLQYFGLVQKYPNREWGITESGKNFLEGNSTAPSFVTTKQKKLSY